MGRSDSEYVYQLFEFQSTHPVWDGTLFLATHAFAWLISIHPSRVGWDKVTNGRTKYQWVFQSTHPVWDGT